MGNFLTIHACSISFRVCLRMMMMMFDCSRGGIQIRTSVMHIQQIRDILDEHWTVSSGVCHNVFITGVSFSYPSSINQRCVSIHRYGV